MHPKHPLRTCQVPAGWVRHLNPSGGGFMGRLDDWNGSDTWRHATVEVKV